MSLHHWALVKLHCWHFKNCFELWCNVEGSFSTQWRLYLYIWAPFPTMG